MKIVTITEIRRDVSEIVSQINEEDAIDEDAIITQHGKPVAVLVSFRQYNMFKMAERIYDMNAVIDKHEQSSSKKLSPEHLEQRRKELRLPPTEFDAATIEHVFGPTKEDSQPE